MTSLSLDEARALAAYADGGLGNCSHIRSAMKKLGAENCDELMEIWSGNQFERALRSEHDARRADPDFNAARLPY